MVFFKFAFYLTLYLLIKLGDGVYALTSPIAAFFRKTFQVVVPKRKAVVAHKINHGYRNTKVQGENTMRLYSRNLRKYFRNLSGFLVFTSRKLVVVVWRFLMIVVRFIKSFFVFVLRAITIPFWGPARLFHSRRKKRGRPQIKNRTTFFYKVKYLLIGSMVALVFVFIPAVFLLFISDLPKLSNLSVRYIPKTTKILDRNGTLLFEIYANQNRTVVPLENVPKRLQQATIAIEDQEFYHHHGFDLKGIARALYIDITRKGLQGGSTITQQLIKSALLTPEPTISRKVRELALAFWAERQYTKDEILELYFNYVPYGGTAWGIESASNVYFGKTVSELSLAESAFLAGLPQAPSVYSPFAGDGQSGKRRQKDVLSAMVKQGYISSGEAEKAFLEKLEFRSPQVPIQAPHFVMYVKDLLVQKYGLFEVERGGLQVTTSLDLSIQRKAEEIVADEVDKYGYLGVGNGASVVTDPENGDILAMVGSRDYFDDLNDGNVNIATSLRQPGSTIKLITYALALSEGLSEATLLDDTPLTINTPGQPPYVPVNYDGRFHGRVPLRIAFANSYNIPAVRLAQRFGVEKILSFGKDMGITSWDSPERYGFSITLGAAEVSMLELATAYGVIANQGERVDLDPVLQIVNSEGVILQKKEAKGIRVLDPGVAFIIEDILADNKARSLSFGSNSPLVIADNRVSVKTGTTDNKRDNWTVGFTQDFVVATWVGNNDNTPLSQALASGITGAAPMWSRIMTTLLEGGKKNQISIPVGVTSKECYGYTAFFVVGTEKQQCRYSRPTPSFRQE